PSGDSVRAVDQAVRRRAIGPSQGPARSDRRIGRHDVGDRSGRRRLHGRGRARPRWDAQGLSGDGAGARERSPRAAPRGDPLPGAPDPAGARIFTDPGRGALVIDLAPLELPARTPHHALAQPPVATLEIPSDGYIHGFRVAVVDSAGRELSDELIHHFNLIDPDHRELFLPISRRLLAAGHETGTIRLPRLLFGLPLKRGEHVVASGMVENLTPTSFRQARVRLVMSFTPAKRP